MQSNTIVSKMRYSSICGVVVTFRPSPQVFKNLEVLGEQVGHTIVVDNTPDAENVLADLERLEFCKAIRNQKNLGLAEALNIGIRQAISMGCEWIFTFDQDSQITDGYVENMLAAHDDASRHSRVGMVFPAAQDARLGFTYSPARSTNGDVLVGMTSGALLHREVFTSVGPMESEFVIDQIDFDYCLRMRRLGFRLIDCPKALLVHSLGYLTFHKFLGRSLYNTNHSAKRRYYITRNRLILMKRYLYKDPEWVRYDLSKMMQETLTLFLFERDRLTKSIYMARAVFDAVFGRLGQRVPL